MQEIVSTIWPIPTTWDQSSIIPSESTSRKLTIYNSPTQIPRTRIRRRNPSSAIWRSSMVKWRKKIPKEPGLKWFAQSLPSKPQINPTTSPAPTAKRKSMTNSTASAPTAINPTSRPVQGISCRCSSVTISTASGSTPMTKLPPPSQESQLQSLQSSQNKTSKTS